MYEKYITGNQQQIIEKEISDLEDRVVEITQAEQWTKKNFTKIRRV